MDILNQYIVTVAEALSNKSLDMQVWEQNSDPHDSHKIRVGTVACL